MTEIQIDPIKSIAQLLKSGEATFVPADLKSDVWDKFGFVKFDGRVLKEKILCLKCYAPFTLKDKIGNS